MKKNSLLAVVVLPLVLSLAFSACSKKNVKGSSADNPDMVTDTATIPGLDVQEGASTEADIRGGEFASQETIKAVNFEYDRYELSEASREVLQSNALLIKARKDWSVLVEGHCDDRGTTEYNLALGQKRAKAVRDYYVRLGVADSAIGTISYGEEKPLCTDATDACWLSNRRAETKVRGN